jgi:hypothetical protein
MSLDEDVVYNASAQLFKASKIAKLPSYKQQELEGFSQVVTLNRKLSNLPATDAYKEFLQLDEALQTTLKQWNPDAAYVEAPQMGVIEKFKERVGKPALEKVVAYGDFLNQPYRAARVQKQQNLSWKESWRTAKGGRALFDLERESKVDEFYEPAVAKIAKQLSIGRTVGEVAATLETPAEFNAFEMMLRGGEEAQVFKDAIKDYDTAKISIGRDLFYKAFDVDPGEFGLNRRAFNRFSGAIDLATQIFFDPITYIPIAGQAYKGSVLAIKRIVDLEVGSVPRGLAVDQAFDNIIYGSRVTRYFDELGPLVKQYKEGSEAGASLAAKEQADLAFSQIVRQFPEMPLEALPELALNNVFDAASAKNFLTNVDDATLLLKGQQIKFRSILPTYGLIKSAKRNIRNATLNTLGINKRVPLEGISQTGPITPQQLLKEIAEGELSADFVEKIVPILQKRKTALDRFVRQFEKLPGFKNLKIGSQIDQAGKKLDQGISSTKDVIGLARLAFDRPIADAIGRSWIQAGAGERRLIRNGLVLAVAHAIGATATPQSRAAISQSFSSLSRGSYAVPRNATDDYLATLPKDAASKIKAFQDPEDLSTAVAREVEINPAVGPDGFQNAVARWQLSNELTIPPIHEWMKIANSNKLNSLSYIGSFTNGKVATGLTDLWAAVTLLPRLGIRSVLEEVLVYGLVAPLSTLKDLMTIGYPAMRTLRRIAAQDDAISKAGPEGLGVPTRVLDRFFYKEDKKIRELAKTKNPDKIMEAAVISFNRGRLAPAIRNTKFADEFLEDSVKYGFGGKNLTDISVRASQGPRVVALDTIGAANRSSLTNASNNKVITLNLELEEAFKNLKPSGEFRQIASVEPQKYYLNWLQQIDLAVTQNGPYTRIALDNYTNPEEAVRKIAEALKKDPEDLRNFANAYNFDIENVPVEFAEDLALSIYQAALDPFRNAQGGVNPALIKLVRKPNGNLDSSLITQDQLKKFSRQDIPSTVIGRDYVEVAENTGGMLQNIINYQYDWVDRQISTLVREPFYFANVYGFRKELVGLQARKKAELINKLGYSEAAAEAASRQYVHNLAEEMAVKRTLDYVDNPLARSNFAWTMRNFARFYRAQEDFYRRAYRTVFKNPGSLVRFRLATDGLDHSGFVFQNDTETMLGAGEGERYFMFPGDEIINTMFSSVMKVFGKDVVFPMPLEFTGKVKMLTPSLDPEAAIPAFSGPLSGVTLKALETIMPSFMGPIKDNLLQTTLGRFGKDATWTDVVIPSNMKRFYNAFMDKDEADSQFASAGRKAAAYLAATGNGIQEGASEAEKLEYRRKLEATATNIVVTRFFLGLYAPVTPMVGFGKDVPAFLKETGTVNYKAEFNKLVNELVEKGVDNPYNEALTQWAKINPELLVYTIGETDANKIAMVKKTKDAGVWVRKNKELVNKYPEGSAFFIPHTGEFNFDEYAFLKREGYIEALPIEEFLKRVTVAEQRQGYYDLKRQYDDLIESNANPTIKTYYRKQWEEASKEYRADKPLLVEDLQTRDAFQKIENAYADLKNLVLSEDAPSGERSIRFKSMISEYESSQVALSLLSENTKFQRIQREKIRTSTLRAIEQIAAGDANAEAAVNVLFRRLIGA